jgi:hypothetical protein
VSRYKYFYFNASSEATDAKSCDLVNSTGVPPYPLIQLPAVYCSPKKKKLKIKYIHGSKFQNVHQTCSTWEWAITWWNTAARTCPVLDSSSFAPVLTIPRRTCLHSASSVHAVRISCCVIAMMAFRKPLFINKLYHIYVCSTNITLCTAFSDQPRGLVVGVSDY